MKRLISCLNKCDGLALVALHGTGTQGGKARIYSYFVHDSPSKSEKVNFVKEQCGYYGMGGKPPADARYYLHHLEYNSYGVKYSYCDEKGVNHDCTATWKELTDKIDELIIKGTYLDDEDLKEYQSMQNENGGGYNVNEI